MIPLESLWPWRGILTALDVLIKATDFCNFWLRCKWKVFFRRWLRCDCSASEQLWRRLFKKYAPVIPQNCQIRSFFFYVYSSTSLRPETFLVIFTTPQYFSASLACRALDSGILDFLTVFCDAFVDHSWDDLIYFSLVRNDHTTFVMILLNCRESFNIYRDSWSLIACYETLWLFRSSFLALVVFLCDYRFKCFSSIVGWCDRRRRGYVWAKFSMAADCMDLVHTQSVVHMLVRNRILLYDLSFDRRLLVHLDWLTWWGRRRINN